jgi:hypothetical protein
MRVVVAILSFALAAPFLAYCGLLSYRLVRYLIAMGEFDGIVEDTVWDLLIAFVVGLFCIVTGLVALNFKPRRRE